MNSAPLGYAVRLEPASVLYFLRCQIFQFISSLPSRLITAMAMLVSLVLIFKDSPGGIGGTGAPLPIHKLAQCEYKSHIFLYFSRIKMLTYYYFHENILTYMGIYPTYVRRSQETLKAAGDDMERDTAINSVNLADAIKNIQQATKLLDFLHVSGELATNFHRHQARIESASEEVQPALSALWQFIESASSVEHIAGVLDQYFQIAISMRLELLAAVVQHAPLAKDLDRMVLSSLELLNTASAWNMMFYRSMSPALLGARAQILEIWHSKSSDGAHIPHLIPEIISRHNIVFEQQRVTLWQTLLQSMLMETAGAESLTRQQIQALVEMTGRLAKCIPLRLDDLSAKHCMYIDPASCRTVWGSAGEGIAGFAVAREDICKAFSQPQIQHCSKASQTESHTLLPWPRAGWTGERQPPSIGMTCDARPAVIRFNYFGVMRQIQQEIHLEKTDGLASNCIIDHATDSACVITLRRPVSLVANIGQLVAVSADHHHWRCGMVIWMQWHGTTSPRLSVGVEFLPGSPRIASVRAMQQQPTARLADLIALEDANQASPHLFITPRNEIAIESAFQEIDRLTGFSAQSILHRGKDYEVISAITTGFRFDGLHHTKSNLNKQNGRMLLHSAIALA